MSGVVWLTRGGAGGGAQAVEVLRLLGQAFAAPARHAFYAHLFDACPHGGVAHQVLLWVKADMVAAATGTAAADAERAPAWFSGPNLVKLLARVWQVSPALQKRGLAPQDLDRVRGGWASGPNAYVLTGAGRPPDHGGP